MSFNENLGKAKDGNRRAYGILCNDYADRLYTVAMLVLRNEDAVSVVKAAFDDGFGGIGRINDSNHLCAWLSRELTKHIVARLKEYRSENITVSGENIPEKEVFCRLNDLDRLVYALNLAFGYKTKEISVITGLKEETAQRKINDSEKKLNNDFDALKAFFEKSEAPDELITKEPKVHDLTVEIDHSINDDMVSEMERIIAFAEAEENAEHNISAESSPKLIRFQPAPTEDDEPPVKKAEPVRMAINTAPPVEEQVKEEPAPEQETVPQPEPEPVVQPEPQKKTDEKPREIDAKTFINVITTQRIKGSEFLKLMGNTKISNSVYREIEQNPNLTKERLVELLESSPLTSEDYYKILTAVKQRSELMNKREELRQKQQQAGLFTINKQREEPKPEAVSPDINDTHTFAANDFEKAAEPEPVKITRSEPVKPVESEPVKTVQPESVRPSRPEPPVRPFAPRIDVEPDDDDDDDLDDDDKKTAPPTAEEANTAPTANDPETGKRQRYKGREFFIDDDVYYKGVNNGKIAFCAVCAVILIGLSFGIRYINTGSLLPSENSSHITAEKEENLPEEYLSDNDIYTAITMLKAAETKNEASYLRADGKAYSEILTTDFAEDGDRLYIFHENKILVYDLASENPYIFTELSIDKNREFIGFTVANGKIYLFYKAANAENFSYTVSNTAEDGTVTTEEKGAQTERNVVMAECYGEDLTFLYKYSQDGDFVSAKVSPESVTLVTALNTSKEAVRELRETYLPSYCYGDGNKSYVGYDMITVPAEIEYNGFTVIGTATDTEARVSAVLGGSAAYAEFEGEKINLTIPDRNKTFSEVFRFIGTSLTPDSSAVYAGECYGTEFINDGGNVVTSYDSNLNCTMVKKKIGEEYVELSGIAPLEKLKTAVYTEKYVYILTENADKKDMLYCVDISGNELIAVEADSKAVYTDKLKAYGDELLGLSVTADENGNRTGLKLTVYGYENGLTEKRSAVITIDENTAAEYIKYLSADAEKSNLRIAADSEKGYIAVSTVYFDGISEIERVISFKDDGSALTEIPDLLLFDIQSDYRYLKFRNNVLYVITESSVVAVNPETGEPVDYFNEFTDEAENSDDTTEEATIE